MTGQSDIVHQINDDGTALADLEQAANALIDPTISADVIEQGLDFIYANSGEHLAPVLDDIQTSTALLVNGFEHLGAKLQAAVTMAKRLREQRESARRTLDELKTAIAVHDSSHPDLNNLIDSLTESITWEIEESVWDMIWEHVIDRITDDSPLDHMQANRLLAILTEGEVEHDSPVWSEITEWIEFVDRQLGYSE